MRDVPEVTHDTTDEPGLDPLEESTGPVRASTGVAPAWR